MTKRISDAIEQRNREIEFKRKVEAIKECHKNAREKIDNMLNEQQRQINQLMEFMK